MSKFVFPAIFLACIACLATASEPVQDEFQLAFSPSTQTLTFPAQIQNGQDTMKLYVSEVQENPIPVQVGTLHPLPIRYIKDTVPLAQTAQPTTTVAQPKENNEGIIKRIMEAQRRGIKQVSEVAALMVNTVEKERIQLLQSMIDKNAFSYLTSRINQTIRSIIDAKLRAIFMIKAKAQGFMSQIAGASKNAANKVMDKIGFLNQRSGESEIEAESTEVPRNAPQVIEVNLATIKENLDDLDEFSRKLATASLEQPAKVSSQLLDRIVKREPRLDSHIKEMLAAGLIVKV